MKKGLNQRLRSLAYPLRVLGRHGRVLRRGGASPDLCVQNVSLATVRRLNWSREMGGRLGGHWNASLGMQTKAVGREALFQK